MKAYPLQMGITPQGTIILTQTNDEDEQEHIITLAPGQVEMLVSSLRIAAEALQAPGRSDPTAPLTSST